ncbi:hypothetical protein [Lewinella sp. W8]|uniref:hypothetical protein n=1 Tax=Lewinella sp. W8 TaxID=2528208 RepID=UPI001068AB86|nr:hypothetical protein [Lewinella sp. W8]MTB52536.1 hypothetical protein [Lewinella sp. W8]
MLTRFFLVLLVLGPVFCSAQTERLFVFGHSLIDHRPPAIATPSDETTVPHWMYLLALASGKDFSAGGQYGFLTTHRNLPPTSQWGYDLVPGVWESDTEAFSEADVTSVLLTAANFIQNDILPGQDYAGQPGVSPVSATEEIFDWVSLQEPGTRLYIYENWPETNLAIPNPTYPLNDAEFTAYNLHTLGSFHTWWVDYHDLVRASRPNLQVKMIPVGPILADLFEGNLGNQIPYTELYEDLDPHGRATLYFLAAMVTYSAIFQERVPQGYVVPDIVHEEVRNNYVAISDFIWNELRSFNTPDGQSRVFFGALPVELVAFRGTTDGKTVQLDWGTSAEIGTDRFIVERRGPAGGSFSPLGAVAAEGRPADYRFRDPQPQAGNNTYRLRIEDADGSMEYSPLVAVFVPEGAEELRVVRHSDLEYRVYGLAEGSRIQLLDVNGKVLLERKELFNGNLLQLPQRLAAGMYFLRASTRPGTVQTARVLVPR